MLFNIWLYYKYIYSYPFKPSLFSTIITPAVNVLFRWTGPWWRIRITLKWWSSSNVSARTLLHRLVPSPAVVLVWANACSFNAFNSRVSCLQRAPMWLSRCWGGPRGSPRSPSLRRSRRCWAWVSPPPTPPPRSAPTVPWTGSPPIWPRRHGYRLSFLCSSLKINK